MRNRITLDAMETGCCCKCVYSQSDGDNTLELYMWSVGHNPYIGLIWEDEGSAMGATAECTILENGDAYYSADPEIFTGNRVIKMTVYWDGDHSNEMIFNCINLKPNSDFTVTRIAENTFQVSAVGDDKLPIATTTSLGVVQIGDGLEVTAEGVLSATAEGGGDVIEKAIIIMQNDVTHLVHAYTKIGYFHGNELVYIGADSRIIVGGAIFHAEADVVNEIQYGALILERALWQNTIQTVTFTARIQKYASSTKLYTIQVLLNGAGRTSLTSPIPQFGFQCIYKVIYSPESYPDSYPFGCVDCLINFVYHKSDDTLLTFNVGVGRVGFNSIDEYNAAMGLTHEPVIGETVEETVDKVADGDDYKTVLEKAMAYTDAQVAAAKALTNEKIETVADSLTDTNANVSTNALGIAENKAAIDKINDADAGILAQSKLYTDNTADTLREELGTDGA